MASANAGTKPLIHNQRQRAPRLNAQSSSATPPFLKYIFLFVVAIVCVILIVTFRHHMTFGVKNIPSLPKDYIPSYKTTNNDEQQQLASPSHIKDVDDILDQLQLHKMKSPQNDKEEEITKKKKNEEASKENLKCGDIEATRKIFSSLKVINDESKINIWPLPQSFTLFEDIVSINALSFEYESNINHAILTKAINRYKSIIFSHKSKRIYDDDESLNTINKLIIYVSDNGEDDSLNIGFDEEYELIIHDPAHEHSCNEIILRSHKIYGALRGLETLSQLIRYNFETDSYETHIGIIRDFPRYIHRGLLLDTARHFHPISAIKRLLLSMSFVKFNVFHWHIVDEEAFPYQSSAYPNLWNGSYSFVERYSVEDVLEIIDYAKDLGIRIIPEFDTPGHAGSWCKGYPQLCISAKCRHPSEHLLDPSKEFTWNLIDALFEEASLRFFDSLFHLGSDEVIHDCYERDVDVQKFVKKNAHIGSGSKAVYKYFVDRTSRIAIKYGKRPIVWNEVYDNFGNELDKKLIIQLWQGGERQKRQKMIDEGFEIIVSYGWYLDHLDNKWADMYMEDPRDGLSGHNVKNVIGGETCMWSEKIDLSNLLSTIWPKAATVAERLWSHQNVKNVQNAHKRYQWLRCLMIRRGIAASPTGKQFGKEKMSGSCLSQ